MARYKCNVGDDSDCIFVLYHIGSTEIVILHNFQWLALRNRLSWDLCLKYWTLALIKWTLTEFLHPVKYQIRDISHSKMEKLKYSSGPKTMIFIIINKIIILDVIISCDPITWQNHDDLGIWSFPKFSKLLLFDPFGTWLRTVWSAWRALTSFI